MPKDHSKKQKKGTHETGFEEDLSGVILISPRHSVNETHAPTRKTSISLPTNTSSVDVNGQSHRPKPKKTSSSKPSCSHPLTPKSSPTFNVSMTEYLPSEHPNVGLAVQGTSANQMPYTYPHVQSDPAYYESQSLYFRPNPPENHSSFMRPDLQHSYHQNEAFYRQNGLPSQVNPVDISEWLQDPHQSYPNSDQMLHEHINFIEMKKYNNKAHSTHSESGVRYKQHTPIYRNEYLTERNGRQIRSDTLEAQDNSQSHHHSYFNSISHNFESDYYGYNKSMEEVDIPSMDKVTVENDFKIPTPEVTSPSFPEMSASALPDWFANRQEDCIHQTSTKPTPAEYAQAAIFGTKGLKTKRLWSTRYMPPIEMISPEPINLRVSRFKKTRHDNRVHVWQEGLVNVHDTTVHVVPKNVLGLLKKSDPTFPPKIPENVGNRCSFCQDIVVKDVYLQAVLSMAKCHFLKDFHKLMTSIKKQSEEQAILVEYDLNNLDCFTVEIKPNKGVYQRGEFLFQIAVSYNYPQKPPLVRCICQIFHRDISDGEICINLFKGWNTNYNLLHVIKGLLLLFHEPGLKEPHFTEANIEASLRGGIVCGIKYTTNPRWTEAAPPPHPPISSPPRSLGPIRLNSTDSCETNTDFRHFDPDDRRDSPEAISSSPLLLHLSEGILLSYLSSEKDNFMTGSPSVFQHELLPLLPRYTSSLSCSTRDGSMSASRRAASIVINFGADSGRHLADKLGIPLPLLSSIREDSLLILNQDYANGLPAIYLRRYPSLDVCSQSWKLSLPPEGMLSRVIHHCGQWAAFKSLLNRTRISESFRDLGLLVLAGEVVSDSVLTAVASWTEGTRVIVTKSSLSGCIEGLLKFHHSYSI